MSKKKVCIISDSAACLHIGQSIVSYELLTRLKKDYEVSQVGFAHADVKPEFERKCDFPIVPCQRSDMLDSNRVVQLLMQAGNPDVVIMSHDLWMLPTINDVRSKMPNTRFIGYITVDGEPAYYGWRNFVKPYDKILAPTPFTKKTLLDRWMDLNIDVVPYGIDHSIFRAPRQGKDQLKVDIIRAQPQFGGWLNIPNKFVAIYVGANQDRKNLGLMHEAWKEFEKDKKHSVMLLMFVHSASLTQEVGSYDLSVFLHDTETLRIINQPQPDNIIGQFMSASDVLLHPCAGGGFELTVMQAMACGTVPVILPYAAVSDYATTDNSYPVPYELHVGGYHVHRAVASSGDVAKQLNEAYKNPVERIRRANNGIDTAQAYTWDRSAEGVKKAIEEVLTITRNTMYFAKVN